MTYPPYSEDADDPEGLYGPTAPEPGSRGRALWAFLALGGAAVVIVALMVIFLGNQGGGGHHPHGLTLPGPSRSADGGTPGSTGARSPGATATQPPSGGASVGTTSSAAPTTAVPTAPRTSCPTSAACVSDGDPGQVIEAVNAYRSQHGASSLPGSVSPDTQQCAVHAGEGSACPANYSWEPVETADGAKVIEKIVARGSGKDWLLDSRATSVTVGWAYVPAGQHGGHYSCAVVLVD